MTTITLTNDFHGTAAVVRPVAITGGRFAGWHKITRRTARRLRLTLCGSPACLSGGTFGERGNLRLEVIGLDEDRNYVIDLATSLREAHV